MSEPSEDLDREHDAPGRTEAEIDRAFRLRPERAPVVRLSRKMLIGVGSAGAIALGAALMFGLQRPEKKPAAEELYQTSRKPAAGGLAALPKDYAQIPKLGPPLPGDFARSPLAQRMAAEQGGTVGAPMPPPPGAAAPQPNPELQRRAQERDAALRGDLFAAKASGVSEATAAPDPVANAGSEPAVKLAAAPSAAERKHAFLTASGDRLTVNSGTLEPAISPNVVQAGAIISAALVTGLRSDLPGQVVAQVTENVFDSPTGRTILIPQGTKLIGTYDHDVAAGQSRALVAWTRLILPGGGSVTLDRMPGADTAGYGGLQDRVDNHWGGVLKAALVSTVLGIGAQSGSGNSRSDLARALRDGASESLSRTGRQIVERELDRPPTITIRPGYPVRVIVTRDIVLQPWNAS